MGSNHEKKLEVENLVTHTPFNSTKLLRVQKSRLCADSEPVLYDP